jgi:hypothetical protein
MNIINYGFESELIGSRRLDANISARSHSSASMIGTQLNRIRLVNQNQFTSRLPGILSEHEFNLSKSNLNKIFCAKWLDERKVIMGTKCNKVKQLKITFNA